MILRLSWHLWKENISFQHAVVIKAPSVNSCCVLQSLIIVRFDKKQWIHLFSYVVWVGLNGFPVKYYSLNTKIILGLVFQSFYLTSVEKALIYMHWTTEWRRAGANMTFKIMSLILPGQPIQLWCDTCVCLGMYC